MCAGWEWTDASAWRNGWRESQPITLVVVPCKNFILLLFIIPYSLSSNLIGTEGAIALGMGLSKNTVLHTLECVRYFSSVRWEDPGQ